MNILKPMPSQTIAGHIQSVWMVLNQLASKLAQMRRLMQQTIEYLNYLKNHFMSFFCIS
jgi:hypothetical protein